MAVVLTLCALITFVPAVLLLILTVLNRTRGQPRPRL